MKRALAIASIAVAVGLASGCGGDDEPETTSAATKWADAFCAALGTWGNELQHATQTLTLSPSTETIQLAGEDVSTATDKLVAQLEALGAPGTESGQEVVDAVNGLAATLEDQIGEVERAIEGVSEEAGPTASIPAVSKAFAAMRTASSSALQSIVTAVRASGLEDAFEQASSCDPLTDTSG